MNSLPAWSQRAVKWGWYGLLLLGVGGGVVGGMGGLGGCDQPRQGRPELDPRDKVQRTVHPALQGTIGEVAALGTSQPWRVEGYGVVAELPNTGGGDMPPNVRFMLSDMLYKAGGGSHSQGTADIHPDRILESNKIAPVEVRGLIPPMATRGTTFDLMVSCLPGNQTTSLKDGLLWTSELRVIGLAGEQWQTRTLASGRGPVFCAPNLQMAATPGAVGQSGGNQRKARILGGGVVTEDMPVTLQLYTPSFRITGLIQRLINSRFPARPPYATAQNDSQISLRIPPEYREHPQEFIDIIVHMYLNQEAPGFTERKAAELVAALRDPMAPHKDISLCLQALGRTIISANLRPHYTSESAVVRFHTARAGAALQDVQAMVVLEQIALDERSGFQREAIAAMAVIANHDRDTMRATVTLSKMLNSTNNQLRIAAYEALLEMKSPAVHTYAVPRKLDIDLLTSDGPTLIYATQSDRPRIAIIGSRLNIAPGVLFVSPDNCLTLNVLGPDADGGAEAPLGLASPTTAPAIKEKESVTLYYRGPLGDKAILLKSSSHLAAILFKLSYVPDPRAEGYDPRRPFIGLSYQRVVETLAALCADKSIDASFVLQTPPVVPPSWTDLAAEARPEAPVLSPTTAPATRPASPLVP